MPVRRTARKTARRSVRKAVEVQESSEIKAQEIHHLHNVMDFKVAIALAFVAVSSMFITVYAKSPIGSLSAVTSTPSVISTTTGRLIVSAKSDYETTSRILVPSVVDPASSTPSAILGKWNLVAENEPVKLTKVRFSAINPDYTVRTNASEFGTMNLYDNSGNLLGSSVISNGFVNYTLNNLIIEPTKPQTLVLKGNITGSGIMKENSIIRFGVNLQVANTWQANGMLSGKALGFGDFKFSGPAYAMAAFSSYMLYHNTVPVVTAGTVGTQLEMSSQAQIFKFTITNPGDREMRFSKFFVNVLANGLNNKGISTTTGFVNNFKLFEANSAGGMGQQIAAANNCVISPTATGPKLGTATIPGVGTCSIGSSFVFFDQKNDTNGSMDSLIVPVGGSRTFIVAADTTNVFIGKMVGSVSVSAKISGNTGTFPSSDPKKVVWGGGGIFYHYTPVAGIENVSAYNQSDSYSVIGSTLVRSL